jgi:hypothetical protein
MSTKPLDRSKPQLSQAEALLNVFTACYKKEGMSKIDTPSFYYTGLTEKSIS